MAKIIKRFVETDAAGMIVHVCTAEYTEPGEIKQADFQSEVDARVKGTAAESAAKGKTFLEVTGGSGLPHPAFHKWDGAKFVKKTRADFGKAPPACEPDQRPDPATFPEPPQ
jgi:hypothetical protein